jgi:cytochrome c biogenesis protein CcmG, thiol:disulfide interchange protein DsbE
MRKIFLVFIFITAMCLSASPEAAPQFALKDLGGTVVTLSSLKGKIIVIDFWAIWCQACKEAFGNLNAIQKDLGDKGVAVVGVNLEKANPQKVASFVKKAGITYTVLLDPEMSTAKLYGVKGVPSLVVIDRDQNLVKIFRGLNKSTEKEIKELLGRLAGK